MLERIPVDRHDATVYRLYSPAAISSLRDMGLDDRQVAEAINAADLEVTEIQVIDAVFKKTSGRSRFSNGDFSVLYTAEDLATAEAEIKSFVSRTQSRGSSASRFYRRVNLHFAGDVKDLRPKTAEWPDLVSDDYSFCQAIGKEVYELQIDGLRSTSARRADGTCLPVFRREAVSNPTDLGFVRVDPNTLGLFELSSP